ncbi:MAG: hypothetical protein DHS20C10_02930 [marine bacterium B5-7]|nr:MAG: hypothetical protein DHS20C10_02930 [marine bacterium B5-7]
MITNTHAPLGPFFRIAKPGVQADGNIQSVGRENSYEIASDYNDSDSSRAGSPLLGESQRVEVRTDLKGLKLPPGKLNELQEKYQMTHAQAQAGAAFHQSQQAFELMNAGAFPVIMYFFALAPEVLNGNHLLLIPLFLMTLEIGNAFYNMFKQPKDKQGRLLLTPAEMARAMKAAELKAERMTDVTPEQFSTLVDSEMQSLQENKKRDVFSNTALLLLMLGLNVAALVGALVASWHDKLGEFAPDPLLFTIIFGVMLVASAMKLYSAQVALEESPEGMKSMKTHDRNMAIAELAVNIFLFTTLVLFLFSPWGMLAGAGLSLGLVGVMLAGFVGKFALKTIGEHLAPKAITHFDTQETKLLVQREQVVNTMFFEKVPSDESAVDVLPAGNTLEALIEKKPEASNDQSPVRVKAS